MPADPRRHVLRLVLSGALACLIAQGLGRFLLTPLLPAMQAAGGLDDGAAGLLAAANLAGYLAGALLVLLAPLSQGAAVQGGLALVIAGSLAMAGPVPLWMPGWALAGLGGALLFLAGSAKAAAGLERAGRGPLAGIVFAGVGVGIALGGLLALAVLPAWRWGWLLGGLAAAGCWLLLAERGPARAASGAAAGRLAWDRPLLALSVAYACAGLAFAAGSTFFVRAVADGDPTRAILAWTVAGAAATPSTLAWVRLGRRAGTRGTRGRDGPPGLGHRAGGPRSVALAGPPGRPPARRHVHRRHRARHDARPRAGTRSTGARGRPGDDRLRPRPGRGSGPH